MKPSSLWFLPISVKGLISAQSYWDKRPYKYIVEFDGIFDKTYPVSSPATHSKQIEGLLLDILIVSSSLSMKSVFDEFKTIVQPISSRSLTCSSLLTMLIAGI